MKQRPLFYHFIRRLWLCSALVLFSDLTAGASQTLPLRASGWVSLPFEAIPSNRVQFLDDGVSIQVDSSAGVLVHRFETSIEVISLRAKGVVRGQKAKEVTDFDDDSVFRFGVIALGEQRLSFFRKLVAAEWVRRLFEMAPSGKGLDRVYFYGLSDRPELVGKSRVHPKSDLLSEEIVAVVGDEGKIDFSWKLKRPLSSVGIWIGVDGDQTKSKFETHITELAVNVP